MSGLSLNAAETRAAPRKPVGADTRRGQYAPMRLAAQYICQIRSDKRVFSLDSAL